MGEGGGTWWEADETRPKRRREDPNPRLYNLQTVLKPRLSTMEVMKHVFGDCDEEVEDENLGALVEPAFGKTSESIQNAADSPENANPFFHINVEGQTCFTPQQAAPTSSYLKSIIFIDQLKSQIKEVTWQFPQSSKSRQETLCNERVYGHVNVLMASGVVRLGENARRSANNMEARRELLLRMYRDSNVLKRERTKDEDSGDDS